MKIALVTGASKGLGLEWCRQLARDGFKVILTARTLGAAEAAVADLARDGLEVVPAAVDVSDEAEISVLSKTIGSQFGHIDLMINNAGINSKDDPDPSVVAKSSELASLDAEEILRHLRINSVSPILMAKHFRALLKASNRPLIVSVSSWLGSISEKTSARGHYAYTTSKAALNMMNRNLAIELASDGIICLVVNPGWVRTSMGGGDADLSAAESVRGLIDNVINKVTSDDNGEFFQWDGARHPW